MFLYLTFNVQPVFIRPLSHRCMPFPPVEKHDKFVRHRCGAMFGGFVEKNSSCSMG